MAPAIRADFFSGCMGFLLCWFFGRADKSQRHAIAAQQDRCDDECRGECQPDPEARAAQVSSWSELWAIDRVTGEGKRFRGESHQAVSEHLREMRRVERDLLEESD